MYYAEILCVKLCFTYISDYSVLLLCHIKVTLYSVSGHLLVIFQGSVKKEKFKTAARHFYHTTPHWHHHVVKLRPCCLLCHMVRFMDHSYWKRRFFYNKVIYVVSVWILLKSFLSLTPPLSVYSSPVGLLLLLHVASITLCPAQLWLIGVLLTTSADSVLSQLQHRWVFLLASCLWSPTARWNARSKKLSVFPPPLFHSGLISPGVSVPVQVPGTDQQGMSHNLGQYWARLQWTTDNRCRPATEKMEGENRGM